MKRRFHLAPHPRLINNPLFSFDVRRIHWGLDESTLLIYSVRCFALICIGLLILWLIVSLPDLRRRSAGDFPFILLAISFLASLALDFTSMSSSLGSISGDVITRRWELLRLSLVTTAQIVAAKHGVAQVRAWRSMIFIIALRVAVLIALLISYFITMLYQNALYPMMPTDVWNEIVAGAIILVLGILYALEPWWRMRTVTALGVAISARARQPTSSVLAATGAIFGLWLLQGIVAFVVIGCISVIILPMTLMEYSISQFIFCSPLVILALIITTVYGFYSIVQTWSLRRAERWVAQAD
jgi:hypothetical protein